MTRGVAGLAPGRERGRVVAHGRSTADGSPATLLAIQESGGAWTFHGLGQPGVWLHKTAAIRLCSAVLDRSMTARAYERWLDVEGTRITEGCRVTQIAVVTRHGAAASRLHRHGDVIGRGRSRVTVVFDSEDRPVSVRPYLLRVTAR